MVSIDEYISQIMFVSPKWHGRLGALGICEQVTVMRARAHQALGTFGHIHKPMLHL